MKKKFFAAVFSMLIFATFVLNVSAAPTVNVKNKPAQSGIEVYGIVENGEENATVILYMAKIARDPETDEIVSRTDSIMDFTRTKNEDGEIKYDFGLIKFPADFANGEYEISVSGYGINGLEPVLYTYANPSDMLAALQAVKTATESESVTVSSAFTEDRAKILGVDLKGFNALKGDGQKAFENIMKKAEYSLPSGAETEADKEQIAAQADIVVEQHRTATAAGLFVEAEDAADVSQWHLEYYASFGFDTYDGDVNAILTKVKSNADYVRRFIAESGTPAKDEIRAALYENALLAYIVKAKADYDVTATHIKKMFEDFGSQADPDAYFKDIDWSGFEDLTSTEQSLVIKAVINESEKFNTCDDAVDEFNHQVELVLNSRKDDDNDNGYRGGGSGGSKYLPAEKPADSSIQSGITAIFSDLNNVDWAIDAIEYLYNRKVISGHPDGSFAPDDNVTRAEFVKMIVAAMAIKGEGNSPFADVSDDSWYAPYVAAAYSEGIVLGDTNGNFYPDAPITREDMVTILYRAINETGSGSLNFTDASDISDYAKDAVGYFSSAGIVNGMGDGRFAAKENATRAQTAVIIYRIINNK